MPDNNRISVTVTDKNVADILGHLDAIEAILPFLLAATRAITM